MTRMSDCLEITFRAYRFMDPFRGRVKKVGPIFFDPMLLSPLVILASSRNQGPIFETMSMPVDTFMGEKTRLACFAVRQS